MSRHFARILTLASRGGPGRSVLPDLLRGLILDEGEQSVTGETLLSYFKYLDSRGRSVLAAEVIAYYMNSGKLNDTQDVFDSLINLFNTNISVNDYSQYSDTALAFINDGSRKKTVVSEIPEVTDNG